MKKFFRITAAVIGAVVAVTVVSLYLNQMNRRGGFDPIPSNTPLPSLRVKDKQVKLPSAGDSFSFSVLGDMRWKSGPRAAILKQAQGSSPLFMVNLGDPVEFARKAEWERYINDLKSTWDPNIPYFHTPGSHCINARLDGIYPAFFQHYFGRTQYAVDAGGWRFVFLDTSRTFLFNSQIKWLKQQLAECRDTGRRAVIFTHCPPMAAEQGITHALVKSSTDKLARAVAGHDVAAIFAAHIHKSQEYAWKGIPVFITSLIERTWASDLPATYLNVSVDGRRMEIETVHLYENGGVKSKKFALLDDGQRNSRNQLQANGVSASMQLSADESSTHVFD